MTTTRQTDDDPFDERGVLRDGRTAITSVMLRNSADNSWRKEMDRRFHDGHDGPVGHRPGFVVGRSVSNDARQAAYKLYDQQITSAWQRDAPGAYPLSAGEGTSCTLNGQAGHLRRHGNVLVCVPDRSNGDSLQRDANESHQQYIARLYDARDAELRDAWRSR